MRGQFLILNILVLLAAGCAPEPELTPKVVPPRGRELIEALRQEHPAKVTDAEWQSVLTEEQYAILREGDTEERFTGKLIKNKANGIYKCAGCGRPLFSSSDKYDSHTGWPSFSDTAYDTAITTATDTSIEPARIEVLCKACRGHLGHLFDDGPEPTHLRYCINSAALEFEAK